MCMDENGYGEKPKHVIMMKKKVCGKLKHKF